MAAFVSMLVVSLFGAAVYRLGLHYADQEREQRLVATDREVSTKKTALQ
jgi:hypothetical protein